MPEFKQDRGGLRLGRQGSGLVTNGTPHGFTAEELTVIVHGSTCPKWEEPTTIEGWKVLELVWEDAGEPFCKVSRCPACGDTVGIQLDGGTIDFGCEPPLTDSPEDQAFLETFVPVARSRGA